MTTSSSPPLVGRQAELAALCSALERARTGASVAVLIDGEAGIGKSTLIAALSEHARSSGVRTVDGPPQAAMDDALPYGPIAGTLRTLVRQLGPAERETVFGPDRGPLSLLVPELHGPPERGTAEGRYGMEQARLRLFSAVADTLERAATGGLVVIVEDLHWTDNSTLDLLSYLLHGAIDGLLLIASHRSDELRHSDPLRARLAEWERLPHVERTSLGRLDDDEVYRLLAPGGPQAVPEALIRDVVLRSAGNPFVAQELLAAGRIGAQPAGLRDAILARLAAASPATQAVVRAAAAGGTTVRHDLLASVIGRDGPELTTGLREAVDDHLIEASADGYAFPHALSREVIHDDLLPGERRQLHQRYLEALTNDPSLAVGCSTAELARHATGAHDHGVALEAWLRAAEEVRRSYAIPEAVQHLVEAIELWPEVPDAEERTGTHLALVHAKVAEYATEASRPRKAIRHAEAALAMLDEHRDPVAVATTYRSLAHARFSLGQPDAEEAYLAGLALLPASEPSTARARVLTSYGFYLLLLGRTAEAEPIVAEAYELAQAHAGLSERLHATTLLAISDAQHGRIDDAERRLRAATEEATAAHEYGRALQARVNLSDALARAGRFDAAIDAALEGVREAGNVIGGHTVFMLLNAVEFAHLRGRFVESRAWLERVSGRMAEGTVRIHGHVQLASQHLADGDLDAARVALSALPATVENGTVGWQHVLPMTALRGRLALAEADPARTLALAESVLDGRPESVGQHRHTGELLALAARASALLRDAEAIARTEARLAAIRADGRSRAAEFEGWLATAEAELHPPGAGHEEAWAHAHATAAERGLRPIAWYAARRLGESLLTAGRTEDACDVVLPALAEAEAAGARALAAELGGLAERGRLLPRTNGGSSNGLTARELEVVGLVAAGRTNRQIGEALFISPKTASAHVSNLLRKLSLDNRAEVAGYAHRHGLV